MTAHTKTLRNIAGVQHSLRPQGEIALSGLALADGSRALASIVPMNFCHWPEGFIFVADGLHRMHKWDGFRAQFVPVGLDAPTGGPTIGSSGSGSITGTYRAYVRFLDADGRPSPLSDASSDLAVSAKSSIDYTSVPVPTDTRVVKRQILRNTAGQLVTWYIDVETDDLWSTSLSSTQTDTQLISNSAEEIPLFDVDGNFLDDLWDTPRKDRHIIATHRSRVFAAGDLVYSRGSASVTFGSTTVTGIGTDWTTYMADRNFLVVGENTRYVISSVNEESQTLELTEVYKGTTNVFGRYMIRSQPVDRTSVFYSEAGNPDGWPINNFFPVSEIGEDITALIPCESMLYIASREATYRFTFNEIPNEDGSVYLATYRGCANQRCWVKMAGGLFILDHLGAYRLEGGAVQELSTPIRDLWSTQCPGEFKIDWARKETFHAAADPENNTVRFFVSFGERRPQNALCYNVLAEQWWLEQYPYPIGASSMAPFERDKLLLVGVGKLLQHGVGNLDGPNDDGYITSSKVTSATTMSVTCLDLALPSEGVVGQPIAIIKGLGEGQQRLIDSVSGTTVNVDQPWLETPDATSVVQVGAIPWRWRSGWIEQSGQDQAPIMVVWSPVDAATFLSFQLFVDHLETPLAMALSHPSSKEKDAVLFQKGKNHALIDLTYKGGYAQFHVAQSNERLQKTGRFLSFELGGFGGPDGVRVNTAWVGR